MSTAPPLPVRAQPTGSAAMPPASAGTMTRADILRMGTQGAPWAFLPIGLRVIAQHPQDADLRLLISAAMVKVGLRTLALEQLAGLAAELAREPMVLAVRSAAERLPDDRVTAAALERTALANLESLGPRLEFSGDLSASLDAWRATLATWSWYRAADGNIVRVRADRAEWRGLGDPRGRVAAALLAEPDGGKPKPFVVEGADPPWLLERVLRTTPRQADGHQPRVTLVQADIGELLDGLAHIDLRSPLSSPRVRAIVGPDAAQRLRAELLSPERQMTTIVGRGLNLSGVRTRLSPTVEQILQEAGTVQLQSDLALRQRVLAMYAGRDAAWWRKRYLEAMGPGCVRERRLRVLVPTCRYSTYIQHSARDLAAAIESLGHRARVLIEPDDHSHLASNAYLKSLAEFEPDLIVLINYSRRNMGGTLNAGGVFPAEVPFVAWIQDSMPHLLDAQTGAAMGPLDFVAGNVREEYFRSFGFPRERSLDAPIVASASKFHTGPVTTASRQRHTCEIAYVSHHAETPEAMHDRKVREAAGSPGLMELVEAMRPGIEPIVSTPIGEPLLTRLQRLAAEALRRNGGDFTSQALIAKLVHMYAMPMADRMLRHQTLAWAAEIAARRGWRMHLYGRGWEQHPTLAAFARGELEHGEDLRSSYQCAAVHLQISAHTVIHQRIVECALSGGFPLCRLHEDDLSSLAHHAGLCAARRAMDERRAHDACDPWTVIGDGYRRFGYSAASSPESLAFTGLVQRLGLHASELVWINSAAVDRLRNDDQSALTRHRSLWWIFGDPADFMAIDNPRFDSLLTRAIEDRDWRECRAASLRTRLRTEMTHAAFAGDLLSFVRDRLA